MRKVKYGNKKHEYDGKVFDSLAEMRRYKELRLLEHAGKITMLQTQVKFILIPAQREMTDEVYTKGKNKGERKPGKLIEKELAYIADFTYFDLESEEFVVEDVKGYRDPSSAGYAKFVIKRKLMLYMHGIRVREVK